MDLDQPDLLDWQPRYPATPGFKRAGTSEDAAKAMDSRAPTLREKVLALLQKDALTADECAAALEETVLAVRPRLSELVKLNLIYDTGLRSKNSSGVSATIWRAC